MANRLNWKKVGHRTLKYRGPVALVVRFNADGVGKAKVLNGEALSELELHRLVSDAEREWCRYKAMEVAR